MPLPSAWDRQKYREYDSSWIEGDGRHGSWLGESNNADIEESDDEEEEEERGEGDMQVDAEVEEEGRMLIS